MTVRVRKARTAAKNTTAPPTQLPAPHHGGHAPHPGEEESVVLAQPEPSAAPTEKDAVRVPPPRLPPPATACHRGWMASPTPAAMPPLRRAKRKSTAKKAAPAPGKDLVGQRVEIHWEAEK
jgi:hypothetical protein